MRDGPPPRIAAQPASQRFSFSSFGIAATAILVAAIALRILAARGTLWLDELWSLMLIDEAKARHDLFWILSADNNHYLNTLYLYLVGADAPVLLQRALSIALGSVTVLIAAPAMLRAGFAGALGAMALFATSYPLVNYGSEARGYAGLILAILVALLLTERVAMAAPSDPRRKLTVWLGVVCTAGALFQPIMLSAVLGLMAWTAWINRPAGAITWLGARTSVAITLRRFSWTARFLIPFAAIIAFGAIQAGGYRIQGSVPFTAEGFVAGYGGLLHLLLGLPEAAPDWVALVIAAGALGLVFLVTQPRDDRRLSLYCIFLLAIPLAMFAVRLPNIHFPRYYLASGIVFLLLLADLFAWAWQRGGAPRVLGVLLLIAILIGNATADARLLRDGRDQSAAVIRMIGDAGPVLVSSDQDVRNRPLVEFLAARMKLPITYVPSAEICKQPVTWLLSSSRESEMPGVIDTSAIGCKKIFTKRAAFPHWGLSGLPWVVYRVQP